MLSMFSSGNNNNSGGFWAAFARILGLKPRSEWDLVKQREAMVSNLENQIVKQTMDQQQHARDLEFRYNQLAQQGQQFLAKLIQNREQFEKSLEFKKKQLSDELGIKEKELDLNLKRLKYDKEYRDKKLGLANKEYDLDKKYKLGYLAVLQAKNDMIKDKMYLDQLWKEKKYSMEKLRAINSFRSNVMREYFNRLREAEKEYDNARMLYQKELGEYNKAVRAYQAYGKYSGQAPPDNAGVLRAYQHMQKTKAEYEKIKKLHPIYTNILNAKDPEELRAFKSSLVKRYGETSNFQGEGEPASLPIEYQGLYYLADKYEKMLGDE